MSLFMREERVASHVLHDLHNHRYRVVQFDYPIEQENNSERWDPAIVAAIEANCVPELVNEDGEIYVPKDPPPKASIPKGKHRDSF
jgi:hypothetical protein